MTDNPIHPDIRDEATELIRALCLVAGDEHLVIDMLANLAQIRGVERARTLCASALAITFGTCMRHPASLDGELEPVYLPQGAHR